MPRENEFTPEPTPEFDYDQDLAEELEAESIMGKFCRGASMELLYNHLHNEEQGFLGNYLRHASSQAKGADSMMDLAGALSCFATLMSGKIKSSNPLFTTHPNLMIALLAPSGAGKEFAITLNQRILKAVNQDQKIGADNISSGEGIASQIRDMGSGGCFFLDEFADKLGDSAQKRSSFVDSIIQNLKTSFTKSDKVWKPNARSDSKLNFEIDMGLVNYYITSTNDSWWTSFRREATGDGLLGRMMLFQSNYKPLSDFDAELEEALAEFDSGKRADDTLPESLLVHVRQWFGQSADEQILAAAGISTEEEKTYHEFRYTREAYVAWSVFRLEIKDNAYRKNDGETPLWQRAMVKVSKLALLFAASAKGSSGDNLIEESHVRMAVEFVKAEIRSTYHAVKTEMADSDQQRIKNKILKALKRFPKGLTKKMFRHRGMSWDEDAKHNAALTALITEQQVLCKTSERGKTVYIHFSYRLDHPDLGESNR
jgi:uncharacterized protein YoaH (UPF0181 family)